MATQSYQIIKMRMDTALELLDQRVNAIQRAVNSQTQVDTTVIMRGLLAAKGYQYTSAELKNKIAELQRKHRDILYNEDDDRTLTAISEERDQVKSNIEAEAERVRAEYRQKITALENESQEKVTAIRGTIESRIRDLDARLDARKNAIVEVEEPGLPADLKSKEEELPILKKLEENSRGEVEQKAEFVRQMRNAMSSLIQDKALVLKARFTDMIAMNKELDVEKALRDDLPDVSTMLNAMSDQDKLKEMVLKLSPAGDAFIRLALAAPAHYEEEGEGSN